MFSTVATKLAEMSARGGYQYRLNPGVKRSWVRCFGLLPRPWQAWQPGDSERGGVDSVRFNLETLQFVASGFDLVDIPANGTYAYLLCRVSGTLTLTDAASVADGTLHPEGPYSLLRRVTVNMDGRQEMDLDGRYWRAFTEIMFSQAPATVNVGITSLPGGDPHPFSGFIVIPFISGRTINPYDTAFPAKQIIKSEFSLRCDWGTVEDLVAGGTYDTKAFTVAPTLEVMAVMSRRPNPIFKAATRFRQFSQVITATGDQRFEVPEQTVIRAFLIRSDGGLGNFAQAVATAGLIDRLSLESAAGLKNIDRVTDDLIREEHRLFGDLDAFFAGYHYLEQAETGKQTLNLSTRELANPNIIAEFGALAAVGATNLDVALIETFAPRI